MSQRYRMTRTNALKRHIVIFCIACVLPLLCTSCRKTRIVDSFPAPCLNNIAFDGTDIWVNCRSAFWRMDTDGHIIEYIDMPSDSEIGKPHGIAFDDEGFWTFSEGDFTLFKLDSNMEILDSVTMPSIFLPVSLTFDGSHLWYNDHFTKKIYRMQTDGTIVASCRWPSEDLDFTGIACNGDDLWAVGSNNLFSLLYHMDTDGNILGIYSVPGLSAIGLSFYNENMLMSSHESLKTPVPTIYVLELPEAQSANR